MTDINDSESTSEPRKKDEFWWIHPNLRGKGALHPGDLPGIPYDSHVWVEYSGESEQEEYTSERAIPFGEGNYTELAKVLFKLNAYRPGPVKGWYIVVCIEPDHAWAVGQMRADAFHPIQVFSDLVFKTEEEARSKAEELRLKTPGVQKTNSNRVAGPLIKKMAADGVESERKFKAKLSGYSRKKKKPG